MVAVGGVSDSGVGNPFAEMYEDGTWTDLPPHPNFETGKVKDLHLILIVNTVKATTAYTGRAKKSVKKNRFACVTAA